MVQGLQMQCRRRRCTPPPPERYETRGTFPDSFILLLANRRKLKVKKSCFIDVLCSRGGPNQSDCEKGGMLTFLANMFGVMQVWSGVPTDRNTA